MNKKGVSDSVVSDLEHVMDLFGILFEEIHIAYTKHRISLKYENVTAEYGKQIRQALARLYQTPLKTDGDQTFAVHETVTHLSKILYDTVRLAGQVENKIKSNVIFSEEALGEMNALLSRTHALFPHVRDALRTGNSLIIAHINKETGDLSSLAVNNVGYHEDRLCKGKCHPKASTIYLQMVQLLQDILWHFTALVGHEIIS